MANLPPKELDDSWDNTDFDEWAFQLLQNRGVHENGCNEGLVAGGDGTETRFQLVGQPVRIDMAFRPVPKKPANLLAICDQTTASNEGFPKCLESFNLGYTAGLLYAKGLISQAMNPERSLFETMTDTARQYCDSDKLKADDGPSDDYVKKTSKAKKRAHRAHSNEGWNEPLMKKPVPTRRAPYTEEEDKTLKELALKIIAEKSDITDSALFRRVHADSGLNRSFSSIESHMKRVIKPKLFDSEYETA